MNPARLAEVKEKGLLEGECEGDLYGGEDGEAWRGCVLGDVAGAGPKEGWWYWVDYRTGKTEWQSPEDKKIAWERIIQDSCNLVRLRAGSGYPCCIRLLEVH